MRKIILLLVLSWHFCFGQQVSERLDKEINRVMNSPAMSSGSMSFYVSDENGNMIYEYFGNKGLSTASTQKIFTAISALDILGKDYQYKTNIYHTGTITEETLNGSLIVFSNGDPTLGSWRYDGYKPEDFKHKLISAIKTQRIKEIKGNLIIDDSYFDFQKNPGGWPWNDLGNYYGTGTWGINWRENQFDVNIEGGSYIGAPTKIKNFSYELKDIQWFNECKTADKSSGDNSIIFTSPFSNVAFVNGTLPAGKTTTVSGSTPNPPLQLAVEIAKWLQEEGIKIDGEITTSSLLQLSGKNIEKHDKKSSILEYYSPKMEKIVYWFLRKSVNLYGETLVKTIGMEKNNNSDHKQSVRYLRNFWKNKGLENSSINFADGSGLSPQNYVSAKAEVQALLYAQKQDWFEIFYDAIPVYNGMKIKSGTVKDCKSYAGYHTSKDGKKYVVSIIVNNHSSLNINSVLFKILDILK